MRIITVGNEKGGVGKTTMAVTMASGLAILGHRVLLIDSDAQGNAALAFGMEREPGFHDLLVNGARWIDVLRSVPYLAWSEPGMHDDGNGSLYLLPSDRTTRDVSNKINDPFIVLRKLAEVVDKFDFVIIDTSPTPSLLHSTIYAATQDYIYVTLPEMWSISGLVDTVSRLDDFNPYRESKGLPPIRLTTILPVRVRTRTIEHDANLDEIRQHFGADIVGPPIRDLIAWSESASRCKTIFAYEPEGQAAADAWAVIETIQGKLYARK